MTTGGKETIKGVLVLYSHHVLLHDGKAAHKAAAICMPHCRKRRTRHMLL